MYINFEHARSCGLIPMDIILLQMIAQNKYEDNSDTLDKFEEELEKFETQGLVKFVQGKGSRNKLIRLSDKGTRILEEIQIPEINNDDLDVYGWLEKRYKEQGKEIGNAKKTKLLIAKFRVHSGITRNHLVYLCKVFMNDEKEMEYSKRLEYLFFKPANAFQTKFEIDQSRLFQYYLMRKEQFDTKFSQINN